MVDLVQWLTAQLDEDQRAAEEALEKTTTTRRRIGGQWVEDTVRPPEWRRSVWDPARVLREITARRRTLAQYEGAVERMDQAMRSNDAAAYQRASTMEVALRAVLRNDAAVYLDRPGYREEWRP